jgi:hypothetical protein
MFTNTINASLPYRKELAALRANQNLATSERFARESALCAKITVLDDKESEANLKAFYAYQRACNRANRANRK